MAMIELPIVDIAAWETGGAAARRAIAATVAETCARAGVLMVTGHGIDPHVIAAMESTTRDFFDRPLAEKLAIDTAGADVVRGYRRIGTTTVAYSLGQVAPPDLREQFITGPEPIAGDPYFDAPETALYFQPNVWPVHPAGMRRAWQAYYRAADGLARRIMQIFAAALALPETWFDDKIDRAISNLIASNYPAQPEPPLPGQLRAGAHTDFGSLTLLLTQDRPGGLQVMGGDGGWHDVAPRPGTFIVNLGDLMAQWTNDRWRSTLHRVVNPPREVAGDSRRQSIVFFHQPNYDAVIECLPTCHGPGDPIRHRPVRSGEHLRAKLRKTQKGVAGAVAEPSNQEKVP